MANSDTFSNITLLNAPDHNIGDEHADREQAQAMHIRLARDTVREMQTAARAGRQLQLNFGSRPTLQFDEHRFPLSLVKSEFRHELYGASVGSDKENLEIDFEGLISHRVILDLAKDTAASALAAADKLKEQMRTWQQDRDSNSSAIVNMAGRKSLNRAALTKASITQSMPSSPAFPPSRKSPTGTLNSSKTTEDRIEDAQRRAFLHCLAIEPLDLATLSRKTRTPEKACAKFAEKYCDDSSDGLLTLDKNAYKDFDVVNLRYATSEQRQKAVDNAIHALDRMRLSRDDKLWQKLLPLEERGKGKCLSRLNLHTGPSERIPNDHRKLLAGAGGEPMARAVSSDGIAKAKKPTEREKQAKRLLSKNKASPAVSAKQPVNKVVKRTEERATPSAKTGQKRKSEPKMLSSEFVEDSDDELGETNEHKGDSRKKLKANGGAAMAAPNASRTPTVAPVKHTGKLARPAVPVARSQATTSSKAKPKDEATRSKASNLTSKAPAVSIRESEQTTSTPVGANKNSHKAAPESRKISAKASTSSLTSSSTPSHRSNASVSSMASSASQGSLKRPLSSSQDESPTKKQRQTGGSNSSSSSPFASSVSSSSSGTAPTKSARLPELPPKRAPVAPLNLPTTKLSELQELHSKVLSDYLQLRMKVERQPSDSDLCAKLAQKSTEYTFLSNEVASLSQVPTSLLVIPATTSFPRDSSAYFLKKYNAMLPSYNTLHAKVSSTAETATAAQKKQLWDLYSRLDELKRLHVAADAGEQLVKRQAVIEASINKPSEQTGEVLTRRQTLEQYKKYHQLFAAWTSFRAAQRRHPSYPHLPPATLHEDAQMYARLCALQTRLVAGFERMRRAFSRAPSGPVSASDGAGPALSAKDAELLAWKTRSRLREWGDGYDAVFSRFGDCTAEEMEALWALQRELQSDQRTVLRSLALGFGARTEGVLDGLRLDNVTVSLGREVSAGHNVGF